MFVFDCDETILVSQGHITVHKPDGEVVQMSSAAFAHYRPSQGDKLDFGAFNHIRKPRKVKKTFDHLKASVAGGVRTVILTARAKGAISAIRKFLAHEGIAADQVEVVALGSSDPYDKARWIEKAAKSGGHSRVEFYDDSKANTAAVADHTKGLSGIEVASKGVPHPKEEDFEGPALDKDFDSDDPTEAVVHYRAKPGEDHDPSKWWDRQSDAFQKRYCEEHQRSKYC